MVDHSHLSAGGDSGSSPSHDVFADNGVSRPSSPVGLGLEPSMGESNPIPVDIVFGSEASDDSQDLGNLMCTDANSGFREVFIAAQSLTTQDRAAATEERKKIKTLMDFISAQGFSLDQVNDFRASGVIRNSALALGVFDEKSIPAKGGILASSPRCASRFVLGSPSIGGLEEGEIPLVGPTSALGSVVPPLAPTIPSWSSIVAGSDPVPARKIHLQYFPPAESDGKVVIKPPVSILKKGLALWSSSLIGYFLHSKLPFKVVEPAAHRLWGRLGLSKVLLHEKGYYVFKFNTVEDRDNVLALSPWHIANKQIILRPWREGANLVRETCTKAPVWVKFHDVPYSYWTEEGLGFVASGVGKPLFLDNATENLVPMNYARICIEIDLFATLPNVLPLMVINDNTDLEEMVEVRVEYQHIPPSCSGCKTFGHSSLRCPKSCFKWRPKPVVTIAAKETIVRAVTSGGSGSSVDWIAVGKAAVPSAMLGPSLDSGGVPGQNSLNAPLSGCLGPSLSAQHSPTASTNAFAALADDVSDSPASSYSHLNDPLFGKLKVIDEKECRDIKSKAIGDLIGSPSAKRRNKGKGRRSPN